MLARVRLSNSYGEYLDLRFEDGISLGSYMGRKIDGLGPVGASIAYTDYARLPGGVFHSARNTARNIVLRLGFNPDYSTNQTVADMRLALNRIVKTGEWIRVRVFDGSSITKYVDGYVETNEPNIFTQDPETTISIVCVKPYFLSSTSSEVSETTGHHVVVPYLGDVDVGFSVELVAATNTSFIRVANVDTGDQLTLSTDLTTNQRVRIRTEDGYKGAWLISSSGVVLSKLIGDIVIDGGWPKLNSTSNTVMVSQNIAPSSSYTLTYRDTYRSAI